MLSNWLLLLGSVWLQFFCKELVHIWEATQPLIWHSFPRVISSQGPAPSLFSLSEFKLQTGCKWFLSIVSFQNICGHCIPRSGDRCPKNTSCISSHQLTSSQSCWSFNNKELHPREVAKTDRGPVSCTLDHSTLSQQMKWCIEDTHVASETHLSPNIQLCPRICSSHLLIPSIMCSSLWP